MKKTSLLLVILSLCIISFAQNAKKNYNAALKFLESENTEAAIEQFSKAIEYNPVFTDAYVQRGLVYEQIKDYKNALKDFQRAGDLDTNDPEILSHIGRIYYLQNELDLGLESVEKAISIRKGYDSPYYVKFDIMIALKRYDEALQVADFVLALNPDYEGYYRKGKAYELLGNLQDAEKFYEKSINKNRKYVDGYIALARVLLAQEDIEAATLSANLALKYDEQSRGGHLVMSQIYIKERKYPKAIDEISKNLLNNPDDIEMLLVRGTYYQEFTQHLNAISDFSKVILLDRNNAEAYFKRAYSYEQTANFDNAIEDYTKVAELSDESNLKAGRLIEDANKRLFELNREEDNPNIVLFSPEEVEKLKVNAPKNAQFITLKGVVNDKNDIKYLKINNQDVEFEMGDDGAEFELTVDIKGKNIFTMTTADIYENKTHNTYTLVYTETDAPKIAVLAPIASDNGEIMLDNFEPDIYFEGQISDESKIKSIYIDGVIASFATNELNPRFNANINIANKNKLTVTAEDIYGNKTEHTYVLNRTQAEDLANNPMGKTWVIFIENSKYETFASLEGPTKDVSLMRAALAKYKINKILHKKDMTKTEMEKFFSIELRDLVKSNNVNSLLIWYAGHGKFINETGYWIPIDAKQDDEFTFFNINTLKASMQSYINTATHLLVITDACESGPTFYQAMRSAPSERTCDDQASLRFKSSQVFSSAGYELAVDNSQFTKTFASSLVNNGNACISIDKIVNTVSGSVTGSGTQKPKFGKIAGLEDENGTFFFMAK